MYLGVGIVEIALGPQHLVVDDGVGELDGRIEDENEGVVELHPESVYLSSIVLTKKMWTKHG